jgi:hypothetical protein
MRRICTYRGENHGPGKDNLKSLTTTPGIREQPRPEAVIRAIFEILSLRALAVAMVE